MSFSRGKTTSISQAQSSKNEKCSCCDAYLWRTAGKPKHIDTDEEAEAYTKACGKILVKDDVLCSKCRLKKYEKLPSASPAKRAVQIATHGSPGFSSSSQSSTSQGSTDSRTDPTFVVVEHPEQAAPRHQSKCRFPRLFQHIRTALSAAHQRTLLSCLSRLDNRLL